MSKPRTIATRDPTLQLIRERKLGSRIARRCGITRQAISLWDEVPGSRVLVVAEITGRPPHLIRPDIYPPSLFAGAAPPPRAENPPEPEADQETEAGPVPPKPPPGRKRMPV